MFVDDPDSIKECFDHIDNYLGENSIQSVINCAAIEMPTPIELLSIKDYQQILTVNVIGGLLVLQEAMPRLRKSKGTIVFSSSLWGRLSGPMVGPYASSKWALEALVDSARRETRSMDFSIVLANIGAVRSNMFANHLKSLEFQFNKLPEESKSIYTNVFDKHLKTLKQVEPYTISPEKVGIELVRITDIKNPKTRYKIGLDVKLLCFLDVILPNSWMDKILGH